MQDFLASRPAQYAVAILLAAAVAAGGFLKGLAHGSYHSQPDHVVLISDEEPGQSLIVRGTVYAPDGRTPVAGIRLNVHHTDAGGYYCRPPSPERDRTLPRDTCPDSPPGTARLRAQLVTDARGRYEFHTIKPGSYPKSRNAAHIHFQASGAGYASQWPSDLLFAGDPFISEGELARQAELGKFRNVCDPQPVENSRAVQCEYNIRLERR
jgi:protocatechuate 3,4-dioxygenase beta subunit